MASALTGAADRSPQMAAESFRRDIREGLEERGGLAREHISRSIRPARVGYGPES
jgi:hypothetical protein